MGEQRTGPPTTSVDVARAAGVSQATVSRVLNGDARVLPQTRERVIAAIERLDYRPNAIARGLVTRATGMVGVVVGDITNPFYPELLEAIGARLAERERRMVLYNSAGQEDDAFVALLLEQRVDGIVLTTARSESRLVEQLVRRRFPLVLANRTTTGVACDSVCGENVAGAASAAEHLLALGHRRIALIAGPDDASTSRDRAAGFRSALERAGAPLAAELAGSGEFRYEPAYRETLRLLALREPPTAIFCANDLMAFGALAAARAAGLGVPERLSIVGFDALPMSAWEPLSLTTVRQPLREMAQAAVDLLIERIAEPAGPPRRIVLPSTLVRRASSGPAPA